MDDHVAITPSILYFGTPVVLLTTENADGTPNITPMSSAWALGEVVVLGLARTGHGARNLTERPDLVINLPGPDQWAAVERLAPLTGANPVPEHKRGRFRYEPDKFAAAGWTGVPAEVVRPPRIGECPLQLEARAAEIRERAGFLVIEADVLRVHCAPDLVVPGTQHVDPAKWSPLIYNFRHYFGLGAQLGHSFRSETVPTRA
ncbi:flavin reductase family protein [Amycolatopsis rhabdoformis]|uniref:Flavin reductase family protein n=1 Tax=Amycolatopsis rhabdoformis TaxID=1448059 RepID=A0ABZ1IGM0_9PSEU|nr:flavin reductase family protein [Amycolatopsis rhabdoformis]WSE33264.1 flavin reductase family protein [Amycolatopsis rhabdoformis]